MSLIENLLSGFDVQSPTGTIIAITGEVGSMESGNYQYKVSYSTLFGETLASAVSASAESHGSMNLSSIPISSNREVIHKNLYRTSVGNTTPFKFLAQINTDATIYNDTANDSELGASEPTANWASSSQRCEGWTGFSKPVVYSTSNVEAAGTTRETATLIETEYVYCTVPTDLNGVILPAIKDNLLGQKFTVVNTDPSKQLSLYPALPTESIGAGAPGNPYIMSAGTSFDVISTGTSTWSAGSIIPSSTPAIVSIGELSTLGNEMLYTIATDTYATTPISAAGRSFVSAASQTEQRAAIGAVIGTDVQAYSDVLSSVVTIGNGAANNIIYTTGAGISNTALGSYARTNLLTATSSADLRTAIGVDYLPGDPNGGVDLSSDIVVGQAATQTLTNKTIDAASGSNTLTIGANTTFDGIAFSTAGSTTNGNVLTVVGGTLQLAAPLTGGDVVGPASATDNAIVRYNSTTGKLIQNSGVIIDDSNNVTGIVGLTATGTIAGSNLTGTLNTAAQTNITSVGTLSSLTVSGTATLNGTVNLNAGATIPTGFDLTITDAPTAATDAANKAYVDSVVSSGGAPLNSAQGSTTGILPNTPVYSSSTSTLTATGAVTSLVLDGITYTASDGKRLLVKDQIDPRQNGVYTRTADSGGNWQLTRVVDMDDPNEAAANTTIFVEGGALYGNTGWTLQSTVTQFDPSLATPGSSDVLWVQTSGSQNIQAGTGMSQTGNTFNVNGTTDRISVGADSVDIAASYIGQSSITTLGTITTGTWNGTTVTPTHGGTGLSDPTTGNVLITAGSSNMTLKTNPTGAFVGTSDTQTLTNKILDGDRINTSSTVFANTNVTTSTLSLDTSSLSAARTIAVPDATDTLALLNSAQTFTNKTLTSNTNNVTARGLWTGSGANSVSTYAASNPSSGQVLTATSATTATWQTLSTSGFTPSRVLFVYQAAPDSSPNWSTLAGALADAVTLTPTSANPIMIQIFPGTYIESNPLTVPAHVTINSTTSSQSSVIIKPSAPAAISPMFNTSGDARLHGFIIDCADGSGGYATVGVNSSGSTGKVDLLANITVRNASDTCFKATGSGARYSHVMICKTCSAQVTVVGHTVINGYESSTGAIMSGIDNNASGFFVSGFAGTLTTGYYVHGDYSYMDFYSIQASVCTNGLRIGGGTTSNSQTDYPTMRAIGCNIGKISGIGILLEEKSFCNFGELRVEDDSGLYTTQIHIRINSPALPAEPNFVSAMYMNARFDKIQFAGAGASTNPPQLRGLNLSERPGEIQNKFQGELTVGLPGRGSECALGEGDSHTLGMMVLHDDGGAFTNITTTVGEPVVNPIAVNLATTAVIDLASAPTTVDGVAPVSGVSRILVKDGSTVNPGTTSVDNGVYLWNGVGVAMTRTADFTSSDTRSHRTWFVVDLGTVNYGSAWKIDGATITNADFITIGTTAWGVEAKSIPLFPSPLTNNDALYIGSISPLIFPGVKIGYLKVLTSGATDIETLLTWEYWNGGGWTKLPIMVTESDSPYANHANKGFGFGETITSPTISYHHHRFGRITSSWATTTINGALGYWMRIRLLDGASITQNPIITGIKIHSNHSEINSDGFVEFFGTARPIVEINIPLSSLNSTGTAGEIAPVTQRLIVSNNPVTIAANRVNSLFANSVTTAGVVVWNSLREIDTSSDLQIKFTMSRSTGGAGNIAMRIDYVYIKNEDVVQNTNGSANAIGKTSGIVVVPTSSAARGVFNTTIPINIIDMDPNIHTMWIKISRIGADASDTYNGDIYIHDIGFIATKWAVGGYYI